MIHTKISNVCILKAKEFEDICINHNIHKNFNEIYFLYCDLVLKLNNWDDYYLTTIFKIDRTNVEKIIYYVNTLFDNIETIQYFITGAIDVHRIKIKVSDKHIENTNQMFAQIKESKYNSKISEEEFLLIINTHCKIPYIPYKLSYLQFYTYYNNYTNKLMIKIKTPFIEFSIDHLQHKIPKQILQYLNLCPTIHKVIEKSKISVLNQI